MPPPVVSGGSSSGGGGVGELVHTSSYRQRGESIDAYEERLYQMAAAAATPAVQEEDHHERGQVRFHSTVSSSFVLSSSFLVEGVRLNFGGD